MIPIVREITISNSDFHDMSFAFGLMISLCNGARSSDLDKIYLNKIEKQNNILNLKPSGRKGVSATTRVINLQIKVFELEKILDICPAKIFDDMLSIDVENLEVSVADASKAKSSSLRNNMFRKWSEKIGYPKCLTDRATLHGMRVGCSMILIAAGFLSMPLKDTVVGLVIKA